MNSGNELDMGKMQALYGWIDVWISFPKWYGKLDFIKWAKSYGQITKKRSKAVL